MLLDKLLLGIAVHVVQMQPASWMCEAASVRSTVDSLPLLTAWPSRRVWPQISKYNFSTGTGSSTGHFTQVVWKASLRLGCAYQLCPTMAGLSGWTNVNFLICRYDPAGGHAPLPLAFSQCSNAARLLQAIIP